MRVLVEQTFTEAVRWLDRLGLLAGETRWTQVGADICPQRRRGSAEATARSAATCRLRRSQTFAKRVGLRPTASEGSTPSRFISCLAAKTAPTGRMAERDAILIGTQDMLLSRALNRGMRLAGHAGLWNSGF